VSGGGIVINVLVDGVVIGQRSDLLSARVYAVGYIEECVESGEIASGTRVEISCRAGRFKVARWEVVASDSVKGA